MSHVLKWFNEVWRFTEELQSGQSRFVCVMEYKVRVIMIPDCFHDILYQEARITLKYDKEVAGIITINTQNNSMYEFKIIEIFSRNKLRLSHDSLTSALPPNMIRREKDARCRDKQNVNISN